MKKTIGIRNTYAKGLIILLMALPVIMSLDITGGDPFGLFLHSLSYHHGGVLPYVTGDFTPLYNAGLVHIYGFNVVGGLLICYKIAKPSDYSRMRFFVQLCAGMFPFLVGIAAIILQFPYKREAISAALCILSLVLNLYLLRTGAFRIVAKAKYQLFESVQDGIIIVNRRDEYMDANDRAKIIFPVLTETESGTPISEIEGFSPVFAQTEGAVNKFTVAHENDVKHYTITRSELLEDHRYVGSTFMVYDITELENLTEKLQELATTDELTQVHNRRNFFSLAENMIATMERLHTNVCVAMLDIDDFKVVNDTYGHPFGDQVLKAVASRCKISLRQSDIFGRYGGEEFAITFYGMDPNSVVRKLEFLRRSINAMEISKGEIKTKVTVSIGFSFVDFETEHPLAQAIVEADLALYQAKQSGKNKVCGTENNRIHFEAPVS